MILYDIATAEKKLMALINATVSHEMRNPCNSIRCQVLIQQQLNKQINDLILNSEITSIKMLKKKLKEILQGYVESVQVQMSSEKILNFLINDILDFSQLKSGKFRKNNSIFDAKASIQEIMKVQQQKAEQLSI